LIHVGWAELLTFAVSNRAAASHSALVPVGPPVVTTTK
jgi:hypothetical protein